MRLNEMETGLAFDAMAKMIPHVSSILQNEALVALNKSYRADKEHTSWAAMLTGAMPELLVTHRADMLSIVSAVCGLTEEDVARQPLGDTVKAFEEAWTDLADFFPVCMRMVASA